MGGTCCSSDQPPSDRTPQLKVTVIQGKDFPSIHSSDSDEEFDVYIQLKYGSADTLHHNSRNDKIAKTKAISITPFANKCEWNETFYLATPALHARYSLEISAYDTHGLSKNHFLGKVRIEYAAHGANNETNLSQRDNHSHKFCNSEAIHFLPNQWYEANTYGVHLTRIENTNSKSDSSTVNGGTVVIKCEFIPGRFNMLDKQNTHKHHKGDGHEHEHKHKHNHSDKHKHKTQKKKKTDYQKL